MIRRWVLDRLSAAPLDEGAHGGADEAEERGATLVLSAMVLVVLIGMAGFAVDLGWLFLKSTETQKAAESAALAGVVHMPNPASTPWGPGAEAFDTAIDVASRNGYTSGVSPNEVLGKPNQLNVSVSTSVPTFFMKVFGINDVSFIRDATAEQLPILKLGSDESSLGTDPNGVNRFFWVSINGEERKKKDGDPFSTRCLTQGCSGVENSEFRDPAYFYGFEVPANGLGALNVQIYDAPHSTDGANLPGDLGGGDDKITFTLFAPPPVPADPTSNLTALCSQTFDKDDDTAKNAWVSLPCQPSSEKGVYVLSIAISGDDTAISSFSLRATVGGTSNVSVFGIGAMSLWMQDAGVAPTFKVVRLDEIYAGTQLIISLFDPGDVSGGSAILRFLGVASGFDCDVRIRDQAGNIVTNWTGDDSPGSAPCEIQTAPKIYNNQWVDLRFEVPDSYTCGSNCWMTVDYDLSAGANVTERTTWTARINGQPIHLIP